MQSCKLRPAVQYDALLLEKIFVRFEVWASFSLPSSLDATAIVFVPHTWALDEKIQTAVGPPKPLTKRSWLSKSLTKHSCDESKLARAFRGE